jgi:chaperone required for assembly of F1-ATPase
MTGWAARRFWTDATAVAVEGGFSVRLDARPVRTPAGAALVLPTLALAKAIAGEWAAQGAMVDPRTMPCARAAHSAIDKIAPQFDAVADDLAGYGATDLVCYRADGPAALVARQAAAWDPLLEFAAQRHGARLVTGIGVTPVAQPPEALARLRAAVFGCDAFTLAALHDLVGLSGSLVIGLAATEQGADIDALWRAARIDEDWQAEIWGRDDIAASDAAGRAAAFGQAHRFLGLLAT